MPRAEGRANNELRPLALHRGVMKYADGSCLVEMGDTHVICTATIEDKVPPFLKGRSTGWVTAEYGMLPRAGKERTPREAARGHQSGRTHEIQRLIGRSLRAVTNLQALGERTVIMDCDIIQADGGTRTASITGAYIALVEALQVLRGQGIFQKLPVTDPVAAISAGIVRGEEMLDLDYEEDSTALVDMNVVMTGSLRLVEIQGTAEGAPFTRDQMNRLLDLATVGIRRLVEDQKRCLEEPPG